MFSRKKMVVDTQNREKGIQVKYHKKNHKTTKDKSNKGTRKQKTINKTD